MLPLLRCGGRRLPLASASLSSSNAALWQRGARSLPQSRFGLASQLAPTTRTTAYKVARSTQPRPLQQHLALLSTTSGPKQQQPAPPASPTSSTTLRQPWYRPYLLLSRLDKPIGSFLLYWPCAWSLTLAAQHLQLPLSTLSYNLILFGTGAMVMRGAGCTINDMWDSRLDAQVERTRSRPLAAGDISMLQAWTFLGLQLSVGLGVLLQLNTYSILLGASSLSLVTIYPLMKRITHWPQLVLGLAFNWGALLGWAALHPPPVWQAVLPLYAGAVCWTIVYDSVYAHQDKRDDVKAGVKSTALLFGEKTRPILTGFSLGFLALATKGVANAAAATSRSPATASTLDLLTSTHPCFLASLVPVAAHLAWQVGTTDLDSRADCWRKFVSNAWLGAMVWAGLMGDYLLAAGKGGWMWGEQAGKVVEAVGAVVGAA